MTEYLGISMVVIVITLCIGILSTIVTENIFKQIEAHKKRVSDIRWKSFGKFIVEMRSKYKDDIDKFIEEMKLNRTKGTMEMVDEKIDELKEKGIKIEDL